VRQALRIGAVALAFEEWLFHVVFDHECFDHIAHRYRHRHCSDEIVARLRERLALGRVGRDCNHAEGRLAPGRP
jgi:hypothetical protein